MNHSPKILIVDDESINLRLTQRVLEGAGYETVEATDGESALRLAHLHRPDLVLLDVNMPGLSGFEVCQVMKADPELQDIFIVMLTAAYTDSDSQSEGLESGADGYIPRPITNRELVARVQAMLRLKQAENARRASEEQLKNQYSILQGVLESADALIFAVDKNYRYIAFNQAHAAMMKTIYGVEIQIGHNLLEYMGVEEDRATAQYNLDRALRGEQLTEEAFSGDEHLSRLYFEVAHNPIKNAAGEVTGVAVFARDATGRKLAEAEMQRQLTQTEQSRRALLSILEDRKRAEETLRASEARFSTIFHTTPIPIAITRLNDSQFVDVNEAWQTMTGYTHAEAVGHTPYEFNLWVELEQRQRLIETLRERGAARDEVQVRRKSGEVREVLMAAQLIELAGERYLLTMAQDITERKQAEVELQQRAVQLDLINHLSAQITAVLELGQLLDQAAYLVHHMFNYHHVAIFLIEGGVLKLKAVSGLYASYFPAGHTQRLDQGINGRVATTGEKIVANDVSQDPHYISLIAAHTVTRSELCLPLVIAGHTEGVLDIQSPQLDGFSQNDVLAMEALAHQLAGAIANARLYEQARQEISERRRIEEKLLAGNRELTLLNQIIAASSGTQDVEPMLETACRELAEAFRVAHVTATLLNEEKNEIVVMARYSDREADLPEPQAEEWLTTVGARLPVDRHNSFVRYLLNHSGPLAVPEAQHDPRLVSLHESFRRRGIISILVLPLRYHEITLGSLNLEATQPRVFSGEEVTLAWSAADQVVDALIRVRLDRERSRAEAEVRASEERFRQVVASISDHIYLSEITATGIHFNHYISPNVERLTGYPPEKFMSNSTFWPIRVIHPDDQAVAAGQLSRLRQGESSEVEYRMVRAEGQVIWVRDNARTVPQDGSVLIYGVVSDITDRKEAEMALREERALLAQRVAERTAELSTANAQLARAAQLKDEFLANMSHELRTPLNAVLGMSEVLRENIYGRLNEEQLNAVSHIEEGGRHLLNLINDILDLSKIEAGKLDLIIASVSVEDVCQASLRFIKQMAQKKRIDVALALDPTAVTIQADERRLKQILVNLLTNAVKFTPEGGRVKLEVTPNAASETLCFTVHDTGIGIAPEDMARLFKPFVQLDSKLSRQHEGTGLGLSLVFRLTELHGGSVNVESTPGQGSRFTVSLPYPVKVSQTEPAPEPILPASGSPGLPELQRVLIIEDSPVAADQLARYLAECNIETVIQPAGAEAVAQTLACQPQMIILDLLLPDLPGWEVLAQLKANPATQHIPVLIVSVVDERSYGLELGAADYLVKPITRTQFYQAMRRVLASQKSPCSEKPLILLAEDNEANISTLSAYLQAKGYRLNLARNGSQAIQKVQEELPAVILMDIQMPVMDGLEAIGRLRADPRFAPIPIIALTALAMPGDRQRCLEAGANEYLSKPISLKGVVELIEQFLLRNPMEHRS